MKISISLSILRFLIGTKIIVAVYRLYEGNIAIESVVYAELHLQALPIECLRAVLLCFDYVCLNHANRSALATSNLFLSEGK